MIEDMMKTLMEKVEYAIVDIMVDHTSVMLFVNRYTPEQAEIPKIIDGREVKILKPL